MNSAICPFPFAEQPALPNRDKYFDNDHLKTIVFPDGERNIPSNSIQKMRKQSVWEDNGESNGFCRNDINNLIRFMNLSSNKISLEELEKLFKLAAQTSNVTDDMIVRRLLFSIDFFLQLLNLDIVKWFGTMDKLNKGKITLHKFQNSLRELAAAVRQPLVFTDSDLSLLCRYITRDTSKPMTLADIQDVYVRFGHAVTEETEKERVVAVVSFLRAALKKVKLRVIDFFHLLDREQTGTITTEVLTHAVRSLIIHPDSLFSEAAKTAITTTTTGAASPLLARRFRKLPSLAIDIPSKYCVAIARAKSYGVIFHRSIRPRQQW